MNREELKKALDESGINPRYYSLNGQDIEDDSFVLGREGYKWLVYYFERGDKFGLQYFYREDEACDYIFNELTSNPYYKNN